MGDIIVFEGMKNTTCDDQAVVVLAPNPASGCFLKVGKCCDVGPFKVGNDTYQSIMIAGL